MSVAPLATQTDLDSTSALVPRFAGSI